LPAVHAVVGVTNYDFRSGIIHCYKKP